MESEPPKIPAGPDISFPVAYQVFAGSEYNLDLKGDGLFTARGDGSAFVFTGKSRGLFSRKPCEWVFPAASIYNVTVEGRQVRFATSGGPAGRPDRPFVFFARDAATAVTVAALLPKRVDADFVAGQGFNERLKALSAGVHPLASVTNVIVALNVIAFLVMAGLLGAGWFDVTDLSPYIRYGSNNGAATTDGEWWRLITSMFLHYGVLHLALNMWALFQAGHFLERLQGRAIYAVTYFGSGIGGGLLTIFWHGDKMWSAGASGAIFGVYGAIIGYLLREKQSVPQSVFLPMLKSTLGFAGYNLFYGMVHPGIDNAAHIGGLLAGIGLGWLMALPLDAEARAQRTPSRLRLGVIGVAVLLGVGYAAAPRFPYSVKDELAWGPALEGMVERENSLLAKQNTALQQWDQRHDNTDACVQLIEHELVPFYTEFAGKLDGLVLTPGRETARRRDALSTFVHARLEGYQHLLPGLRTQDMGEIHNYQVLEGKAAAAIEPFKGPKKP